MAFGLEKLEIPEVILITPKAFSDERGFFMKSYKESGFEANGINFEFKQDNHSKSSKNVLIGLHYQLEPARITPFILYLRRYLLYKY